MIVYAHDSIFAVASASELDRLALLRLGLSGRHTLYVTERPGRQAGHPHFDQWLERQADRLRKEIRLLEQQSGIISTRIATMGAPQLTIWPDGQDLPQSCRGRENLLLSEALRILAEPLGLVVENARNDGCFLRRAFPGHRQAELVRWEKEGWFRFEHAGGIDEMREIVKFRAAGPGSVCWRLGHLVLYDHDGTQPDRPSKSSHELEKVCEKLSMSERHRRLKRRCQENYLPIPALHAASNSRRGVAAADAARLELEIDTYAQHPARHFQPLPGGSGEPFKNLFADDTIRWENSWFVDDGSNPELDAVADWIARHL